MFDFNWQLRFSQRKTIGVYVFPDLSVEVRAPKRTTQRDAIAFLLENKQWILEQLSRYKQNPVPEKRQFQEGALHYYLGKSFPLNIQPTRSKPKVIFTGDVIEVYCFDIQDNAAIKKQLLAWYRQLAQVVYAARLDECFDRFAKYGIDKPAFRVRSMKTRWGSCSSRGHINLGLELIQTPLSYIDYVIVHELCHLIEFSHSPRFYAIQEDIMPDWQQRKQGLNIFPVTRLR